MSGSRAVRLLIRGRVQGVGFRDWLRREATLRGLDGWVRNLASGEVEALVAGPEAAVEALIQSCRRGPRTAEVGEVRVSPGEAPGAPGFRRLPTA